MARLPTPGGDDGNWGTLLNGYLEVEHNAEGAHPDASNTAKGFVELATQEEVNIGADDARAVVPSTLQEKLYSTQTLTDEEIIEWDTAQGAFVDVTLGGNRTLANPTSLINGASYILLIKQDDEGSRTLTFGDAYKFPAGTTPTLSSDPNAVDIIAFISDGTNMYGSFVGNFS